MRGRTQRTIGIVEQAKRLLEEHGVMTLRHLYYLLISAGAIENSMKSYQALGRIISVARRRGEIDYSSLVDGTRSTVKPSSWSGLADFGDAVRQAYRKDLCWAHPRRPAWANSLCQNRRARRPDRGSRDPLMDATANLQLRRLRG